MQEKRVDILLASYNGEKYLKEQLDSILNQTYGNFKLIISDDCSKDSTREILREYEKKDDRIELHFQEKNLGSNKNFEYLLSKVTAEYYMFSDQDDVWLPNKVEICMNKIQEEDSDLVFTDLEVVDQDLNTINKSFNKKMRVYRKAKKYKDFRMEYLYNCVTGCTILAKTSMIKEYLPLPENKDILHDYWIALVTSLKGRISYVDVATIKYRQHGSNQVGTKRYTERFNEFNQKRDYIIDLKINKFKTYLKRSEIFSDKLNKLNSEALEYFERVKNCNNINFKGWKTYHDIFKYDSIGYYIFYFIFYNIPCIFRFGYNIWKFIKNK